MVKKKVKVGYEYALVEDQKWKKCNFFSFIIKLNIRASILGALLTKKYSIARVTSKKHFLEKCKIHIPIQNPSGGPLFPMFFFQSAFSCNGSYEFFI